LTVTTLKNLWKNEYFRTAVMIILIITVVFGFWYGSQIVLNTQYPALAVATGSMCKTQHMYCDGWSHPFERTLHIGDLIIVQGVNPEDIHADPEPDGDIIVFRQLYSDDLIVHRAIERKVENGDIFFVTKGDGNTGPDQQPIPASHVVGKVVLRIPWLGHLALFMHNSSGIFIIVILIVILVIVEFVIPAFTGKKTKAESKEDVEKAFEDKAL